MLASKRGNPWIASEPEVPVDPSLDPEAGWTSHAAAGGMTPTLQVTNDWGGGFEGQLLLNNQTGSALTMWTKQFDAPFTVNSMWDGEGQPRGACPRHRRAPTATATVGRT